MNPLIDRIWAVWSNSAQEELMMMLEEFAEDYFYEDRFMSVMGLLEDAIIDEDYIRVGLLFEKHAPSMMSSTDISLFNELLAEAEYGY